MIRIEPYGQEKKEEWDRFVAASLNGTFLFHRDYMDYHSDRFADGSLMVYSRDKLISLIPANREEGSFHSHGGLSYGSFVVNGKMGASLMMDIFDAWMEYLHGEQYREIIYKPVPYIFHLSPCEYDLYAMFRHSFQLERREISTVIPIGKGRIGGNRKSGYNYAVRKGLELIETEDFSRFIEIANERLETKYHAHAVHTAEELELLKSRFPGEIRLHGVFREGRMLGGALIYLINRALHAQYLYCNDEGREFRALDFMIVSLLREKYAEYDRFDFGKSTEDGGKYLNKPLIKTKEEFGGTSICYDTYRMALV